MRFPSRAATFMRDVQRNNDRDWFKANKDRYDAALEEVTAFAKTCHDALAQHDALVPDKKPVMRIYRDTRFSKDKTPYKQHWGGGMDRLGDERRGGYYWHVEPGGLKTWEEFNSLDAEAFCGGGFWSPEREDLARIRADIASDASPLRELLNSEPIKSSFGGRLYPSDMLKTSPKGYDKEHPAIDLLRHKNFVLIRSFSKAEVASEDFSDQVAQTLLDMRPFLDYMTDVLTTDENGVPLM